MRLLMASSLAFILLGGGSVRAQKHEIGLLIGGARSGDNRFEFPQPGSLRGDTGFTFQFNYSRRIINARVAALYADTPIVITPSTEFRTSNGVFPSDFSSLYFTPGLKLKLAPEFKVSPYGVAGFGFAWQNPSDTRIDGQPNTGDDSRTDTAASFGGGVDVKLSSWFAVRGEVRSFYTVTPQFGINLFTDRQHNIVTTAGAVLRF
jgi:opacity protein-like surface antigen